MRAKPLFQLSVLAAALALTGAVQALGLGRLTVNSSLGQPLSAQIELTSATKDELDSLTARVADPSLYRQNNLAYAPVLSRARVAVERGADGQAVLKITTPTSVNEPYLDLMVEVNWASGRVVREYTFLLDPPGVGVPAPAVEPVTPVRQGSAPARPPAAAAPAPAAAAQQAEPKTAPGGQYTVKRGDNLSKIASDFKPSSVTLEQMLVALFRNNADAFDGNMNRLRAGAIVNIPTAEDAGATAATEATRIVRMQASDWRGYRDRVAAGAPEVQGEGARGAGGRIGTAVEEKAPAAPAGRDQLKVSREAGQGKAAAAEQSTANAKALQDAQTRIADLEKTLKNLQAAVDLKNQTLAQLQAQADAAKGKGAEPAKAPPPPPPPKVEPPKVEPPKAEPPKVEPPKAEPPKPVEPPKAAEPPKVVEPPKAEPPKAPKPVPPVAEPSLLDDVLANTSPWAIGGAALAILGGIAVFIAARRRKTTKFEDSIIAGTDIKTNTVFGSTGGGVVNTGENSLQTDFSREGLGNIDTDEVDPIAEAEVYLAYGRDAQAEEILKEALKKDPTRQEIHLKLLEIHAQHNKPSAFETVATELYSVSQGQGPVWQKAVALGRQLDPANPLFAEGGSPATPVAAAGLAAGSLAAATVTPVPRSEDLEKTLIVPAKPKPADSDDAGLEFRLDEDISVTPASGGKAKPEVDVFADDEPAGVVDTAKAAGAAVAGTATAALAGATALAKAGADKVEDVFAKAPSLEPKFDLDFQLGDDEKPAPLQPAPSPRPVPEVELASTADVAPALTRPQAAIDLDKLDLSFDPDKATFEDPTPSVLDGQWHDAATKLDLAKAYQEMGDVEGAREILQEVLHEGDEQQKVEAQALIAKLG